jgi:hypothetical protein
MLLMLEAPDNKKPEASSGFGLVVMRQLLVSALPRPGPATR